MKYLVLILFLPLLACENEVNLDIASGSRKTVLNCLLQPDDTLTISLTKSALLTDSNHFQTISNALVLLYENQQLVDTCHFYEKNYKSDFKIKAGNAYTIKAMLPDNEIIVASDTVPQKPQVDSFICSQNNKGKLNLHLYLKDDRTVQNFYKIDFLEISAGGKEKKLAISLMENIHYLSLVDTSYLMRDFDVRNNQIYLNMQTDAPRATAIRLKINQVSRAYFLYVTFATQNYVANFGSEYKRVPNYSNVSNHVGILGSSNSFNQILKIE